MPEASETTRNKGETRFSSDQLLFAAKILSCAVSAMVVMANMLPLWIGPAKGSQANLLFGLSPETSSVVYGAFAALFGAVVGFGAFRHKEAR
jgi:hypothetical protein